MAINPHEPTPLEMLTTEELISELDRRYRCVIVLTIAPAKVGDTDEDYGESFKGGAAELIGMMGLAIARLKERHVRFTDEKDGGGDE